MGESKSTHIPNIVYDYHTKDIITHIYEYDGYVIGEMKKA